MTANAKFKEMARIVSAEQQLAALWSATKPSIGREIIDEYISHEQAK
jgi:hypothetical protein